MKKNDFTGRFVWVFFKSKQNKTQSHTSTVNKSSKLRSSTSGTFLNSSRLTRFSLSVKWEWGLQIREAGRRITQSKYSPHCPQSQLDKLLLHPISPKAWPQQKTQESRNGRKPVRNRDGVLKTRPQTRFFICAFLSGEHCWLWLGDSICF